MYQGPSACIWNSFHFDLDQHHIARRLMSANFPPKLTADFLQKKKKNTSPESSLLIHQCSKASPFIALGGSVRSLKKCRRRWSIASILRSSSSINQGPALNTPELAAGNGAWDLALKSNGRLILL